MKKLNKKSMLGFMTASAIVVTTVGSFAVWDKLSDTATGTVQLDSAVVVDIAEEALSYTPVTRTELGDTAPTYTSEPVAIKAAGVPADMATTLTFTPNVTVEGRDVTGEFKVEVLDSNTDTPVSKVEFANPAAAMAGGSYKVSIQPTDATYADKDATVTLKADLTKK